MNAGAWTKAAAAAAALTLSAACACTRPRPSLLRQGGEYEEQGLMNQALTALQGAAALNPADPKPHEALARIYQLRGWTANATQQWEQALADGSPTAKKALFKTYLAWGQDHLRAALWSDAEKDFKKSAGLYPDDPASWPGLARAASLAGDKATALAAYGRCFALVPGNAPLSGTYGALAYAAGRPKEALRAYQRYVRLDPGDPRGWNNLGTVLVGLGRPSKALACFDHALGLAPAMTQALNGKASALYLLGRYPQARALWGRVLDLSPDDPTATQNIRTLVKMGY